MSTLRDDLTQALGARVSFDPEVVEAYCHDLGEMPRALTALFDTRPEAVAVPGDAKEVAAVLAAAGKHKVPVTPRGQATSGYGGVIPTKAGIVLDLSEMTRVLAVDAGNLTADVECGVVWNELSKQLIKQGLDIRVCPTSGPSSTVGGWFAMGGSGIGSMEYGTIGENVLEIDAALMDGTIRTFAGARAEPFHQTCGILGVVTRLRLALRKAEPMRARAAVISTAQGVAALLAGLSQGQPPYSLSIQSAGYMLMRARAEQTSPMASQGFLAVAAYPEGSPRAAVFDELAAGLGARMLDAHAAGHDWEGRFYPMRIKRDGPSLLVGECYLPQQAFPAFFAEVEAALPGEIGLEAVGVRGGRLAILIYIADDAKSPLYPLRMPKATIPLSIARRHGGTAYSPGLWFARHAAELFGPAKMDTVSELKKSLDPDGLLNPGKILGANVLGIPGAEISSLIALGSGLAAPVARLLPYTRRAASTGSHS